MVSLTVGASPHALGPSFFGANVVNAFNANGVPAWDDPKTAYWLTTLGITSIRYPGGAVGNYWDWQAGAKCGKTGHDTLTPFASLAQVTNTVPSYVLNVMTAVFHPGCNLSPAPQNDAEMISDQIAMLNEAGTLGLGGTRYLELGNEFYLKYDSYIERFPCTQSDCSAGDYSKADDNAGSVYAGDMNSWIAALRQSYPDAQIGAVMYAHSKGPYRTLNWNSGVLSTLQGADAVIFHDYTGAHKERESDQAILASVFGDWSVLEQNLQAVAQRGFSQAWITEWNFGDGTKSQRFAGSWLSALVDFQHLINYLSEPLITREMVWNLSNPITSASLVYFPAQQYTIGGVVYTIPDGQGMLSASGQAVAMTGRALAGATAAASIVATGSPIISGRGFRSFPAITGVFIVHAQQTQLLLANYWGRPLKLFYGPAGSGATVQSISAPSPDTYITPETQVTNATSTSARGIMTVPPYSINLVSIPGE